MNRKNSSCFQVWPTAMVALLLALSPSVFASGPTSGAFGITIDNGQLPPSEVTVNCNNVSGSGPDGFQTWLTTRRIALQNAVSSDCPDGNFTIMDDAPPSVSGLSCDDAVSVTFTITDCDATVTRVFTYRVFDNGDPIITGVGAAELRLSCSVPFPDVPEVTVEDCRPGIVPTLQVSSSQTNNGSRTDYNYTVTRIWTATDGCGNTGTAQQTIIVEDNEPPTFRIPAQTAFDCQADFRDTDLTGVPTEVADNCTPLSDIAISFNDNVITSVGCGGIDRVERTWTVTDASGNNAVQVQVLIVGDDQPPVFTPPAATISVDCADYLNLNVTGQPTDLFDRCDPSPTSSFEDDITPGDCPGNFTVRRRFRVADDCGQVATFDQTITVVDTTAPIFTRAPQDLVTTCNGEFDQIDFFNEWLRDTLNAEWADGCVATEDIDVRIVATGTNDRPELPALTCAAQDGTVRRLSVDIILSDPCGNARVETVEFRQIDGQPINIFNCPASQVVPADSGQCSALVALPAPVIEDQCVSGRVRQLQLRDTARITSDATTEIERGSTPVNEVVLNFDIDGDLPVNASRGGTLVLTLENIDAEGEDEYFDIIGEDGAFIGRTGNSPVQCDDVIHNDTLPTALFNRYARDGRVTIRLVPNIPADRAGTFAINDLCPGGSRVLGYLQQPIRRLTDIVYQVYIDDEPPVVVDPIDTLFTVLDEGVHRIRYEAFDCGGNADDCVFTVTVEDRQPPVVTCPDPVSVDLSPDSCQATLTLPLPVDVTDNCPLLTETVFAAFPDTAAGLFPFERDPNLGTFQARKVEVTIPPLPENLSGTVTLELSYRGSFDAQRAVMDIVAGLSDTLITTNQGDARCDSMTTELLTFTAEEFNALLYEDRSLLLSFMPRPVGFGAGIGLTNCGPVSDTDGTDGTSGVLAVLRYGTLEPAFATSGATELTRRQAGDRFPRVTFNQGVTSFTYVVTDRGGNEGFCSFDVTVNDVTDPEALCQPTTVLVDPSGAAPLTLDPSLIDGGSTDNCGIDSLIATPPTFSCNQYGENVPVLLTVFDAAGNSDTCSTSITLAPELPQPTAATTVCGGDMLQLIANPPTEAAPGQQLYTFRWFNPRGELISTLENPIIPNVDIDDSGVYRVVITGLTGCMAEGLVNIDIGVPPPAPTLDAPSQVCRDEGVLLTLEGDYSGSNSVSYEFYRGSLGEGTLVGESVSSTFFVPFSAEGPNSYYGIAIVDGCPSAISNTEAVSFTDQPTANIIDEDQTVCERAEVVLRAEAVPNVSYVWNGPNGFEASGANVLIEEIGLGDGGFYTLQTVRGEGCFSEPDSVLVTLIPAGRATTLNYNGPLCPGERLVLRTGRVSADRFFFTDPQGREYITREDSLVIENVTPDLIGDWTVSVLRGTCPTLPSQPLNVAFGQLPVIDAMTLPDPVCRGNDVILQATTTVSNSTYAWTGPGNFTSDNVAPVLEAIDTNRNGRYFVEVTSPAGCRTVDSLDIMVMPGISVDTIIVEDSSCLNPGESINILAEVSSEFDGDRFTYRWQTPQGTSTSDTLVVPDAGLASNGTYRLTIMNSTGCNSPTYTQELELDFAPAAPMQPIVEGGQTAVCEQSNLTLLTNDFGPQASYLWRLPDGTNIPTDSNQLELTDLSPALSGGYTVRVIRNGCTSLPSEMRDIQVTAFPVVTVGTDGGACEGQPLRLTATEIVGADYSWRGPNNFSASRPDPVIASADSTIHGGRYSVVVSLNGCATDTLFLDVDISSTPNVPVAQPIASVCVDEPGTTLELSVNPNTATPGARYQWYIMGGTVPVGPPTSDLTLRLDTLGLFSAGGAFDFTVEAQLGGCASANSAPVITNLDVTAEQGANAGADTMVCEGTFVLEAGAVSVGGGRWSVVGGTGDLTVVNPTNSMTAVTGLTGLGSPYQFAWTLSNGGCENYAADTVTITVTDGEAAVAGENIVACIREEVRLNAQPASFAGSEGEWTQALAQEVLGVEIEEPGNPNTLISGLQPDNVYSFTWTVRSACGTKSDVVLVNVSDPSPFAGADFTSCAPNGLARLAADAPTLGSEGRWLALDNDAIAFEDENDPETDATGLITGDNVLVWEVDGGVCGARSLDTVVVTYNAPPTPSDDEIDVPFQGEVTFDPSENDNLPARGAEITFLGQPERGLLVANGDGTYTFTAPDNFVGQISFDYLVESDGCETDRATVTAIVGEGTDCAPPNIFTPNSDGMNDNFVVPCLLDRDRFPQSQVAVYNQWGDEVYRSAAPYRNDWDGTYQGSELPVATYFYIIDFGGERETLSGDVRIER